MKKILVINPGSTSTKVAVYHDSTPVMVKSIPHTADEVKAFDRITDQLPMRLAHIRETLADENIPLDFDAVIGRGGLAKPVEAGCYEINDYMLQAMRDAEHQHACDLGCILADEFAKEIPGCIGLIADPGAVDELNDYARISGSPIMPRICIWHALNQRAIARRYAALHNTTYDALNLIVCHLGGGISIAAHRKGRAIDVNNSLDGEGPFSPERSGSLPAGSLIDLCYSGKYTREQLHKRIAGQAGLTAHLGTNDMREIMQRIDGGDRHAELVVNAMVYHIAKAICAQGAVLAGQVDAILVTGGLANCQYIIDRLTPMVDWLAPVAVFPGEDEMLALAQNALAVLNGEIPAKPFV